jgi:3-hydroxy-D-aspartate aldolase
MDSPSLAWNRALIRQPGSLRRLDSPALLLDLDALEANIAAMAGFARDKGIGLRPHAKTHKSAEIGRRQLAAGAVGLCCAKLGEAEALAAQGLDALLLTAPVMGENKIGRLLALNSRVRDLALVVDHADNVRELSAAAAAAGQALELLVVCDIGSHRFGVTSPEAAVELGRLIAELPAVRLRGIQGYAGFAQHIVNYDERRSATLEAVCRLGRIRDALVEAGHPCEVVTGSGTGTHDIDPELGIFTDLQVGSYVFCDADYDRVQLTRGGERRFRNALFVLTRVVSNRHEGFVTTDAGSKCFATDGPPPTIAWGAPRGSTYRMFGDQFGRIDLPGGHGTMELGALVACIVPHCDPNVNLYDVYHCVRGDTLVDIWAVDGRGRTG